MAIKRPDEYVHNNPALAIADSDNVRGARRRVADREELYGLVAKADQLKENVTIVRILADDENGGVTSEVLLVDDSAIGSTAGWELYSTGSAAPNPGGGGGAVYTTFSFDVAQDGAATYDLPADTVSVAHPLQVQQKGTGPRVVRTILPTHYRLSGNTLIINADASLLAGDTVVGSATSSVPGSGTGGPARDNNNVPESVQTAVTDPSHTWSYGDLLSYGTDDLRNAALDGVVKSDYFDSYEQGSTTDAYRYCYCGQNDGTLGWTRVLKYS